MHECDGRRVAAGGKQQAYDNKASRPRARTRNISSEGNVITSSRKYSLQGTTQGRYLTGGVPPVRFSM